MILVTGANGFVGATLCRALSSRKRSVRATARRESSLMFLSQQLFVTFGLAPDLGDRSSAPVWSALLNDCHTVVHTAAMVHVMSPTVADDTNFFKVNVLGTLELARLAARAGVRRFVFLSTVKVHGEYSEKGLPFSAEQPLAPNGAYAISKQQAEEGLLRIARETGLEVVIIRPPLVYGPGVGGNLEVLIRWMRRGIPLPVGALTHNARSLVGVDNLVDLIVTTIDHPDAANQQFLVSDDHDLSTAELVTQLALAGQLRARTFNIPVPLLRLAARIVGRSSYFDRLTENLQVDITSTKQVLGWQPPLSLSQSMGHLFASGASHEH